MSRCFRPLCCARRNETQSNETLTRLPRLCDSLLRDSRVVILDESSASLDRELDEKLQLVIREEFRGSVVLTIAHRLQVLTFLLLLPCIRSALLILDCFAPQPDRHRL